VSHVNSKIFNVEKEDYSAPSLLVGEGEVGLFDTVNKKFPEIWELYKTMKSLDWDENEFNYGSCVNDFKTCDKSTYDMMIKTLAWQWEADSIASRISPLVGCFVSSSELWAAWQRVSDNELVHAATYSEIVRNSFDDPSEILDEILKVKESLDRLDTVASVLSECHDVAHKHALGRVEKDEAYRSAFLFTVAMLILERIQFMSSFAVTFSICDTGMFQPIGKAIQKIAQDELEVHVELDKAVLKRELKTARGKKVFEENKELISKMVNEVVEGELIWNEYLFSEGRQIVGLNNKYLDNWTLYCAKDVYSFLGIEPEHKLPAKNPLKFMERWLNIGKNQGSAQEEDIAQYKVNVMRRDDEGEEFDVDF